jgi:hypothetical protein
MRDENIKLKLATTPRDKHKVCAFGVLENINNKQQVTWQKFIVYFLKHFMGNERKRTRLIKNLTRTLPKFA